LARREALSSTRGPYQGQVRLTGVRGDAFAPRGPTAAGVGAAFSRKLVARPAGQGLRPAAFRPFQKDATSPPGPAIAGPAASPSRSLALRDLARDVANLQADMLMRPGGASGLDPSIATGPFLVSHLY
jgi:hypothetical protein